MGIYRHVKSQHLLKNELKAYEIKTLKDKTTGKIIKLLNLSNYKSIN